MNRISKGLLYIAFSLYIVIMVWIVSFKCNWDVPVFDCLYWFKPMSLWERLRIAFRVPDFRSALLSDDTILNTLLFVPMGIYLPILSDKGRFFKLLKIALAITVTLETVQLLTCIGAMSAMDIFANTLGFIIGYLIYKLLLRRLSCRTVNIVNGAVMICAFPVAVYAVVNTVLNIQMYTTSYYGL